MSYDKKIALWQGFGSLFVLPAVGFLTAGLFSLNLAALAIGSASMAVIIVAGSRAVALTKKKWAAIEEACQPWENPYIGKMFRGEA